jgi:hypothetical protein
VGEPKRSVRWLILIMLVKNIGNMLLGALLSLIAAYLLIVTFVLKSEIASVGWSSINPMTILIGAPLYTLAWAYWILIPIGSLFGLAIPLLVSKKTRRQALVYGILIGIIIGLVFACFMAYDYAMGTSIGSDDSVKWWSRFWGDFASSLPLTIVYCSIWTSAYSFSKAGGASVEQKSL